MKFGRAAGLLFILKTRAIYILRMPGTIITPLTYLAFFDRYRSAPFGKTHGVQTPHALFMLREDGMEIPHTIPTFLIYRRQNTAGWHHIGPARQARISMLWQLLRILDIPSLIPSHSISCSLR